MAEQLNKLKKKIRSISSTKKITNAMELVATAKMQKIRNTMSAYSVYGDHMTALMKRVASSGKADNPYMKISEDPKRLVILYTGNQGLCGTYNQDILRHAEDYIKEGDLLIVIGTIGMKWAAKQKVEIFKEYEDLRLDEAEELDAFLKLLNETFLERSVGSVDILYCHYVNTLTFKPDVYHYLPLASREGESDDSLIYDPSADAVLDTLIPEYLSSIAVMTYLETKACENAARRNAMDQATENAEELLNDLTLKYNEARQTAITQQVNEITAGADAL